MQLRLPFNGSHPLTQGFGENPDWYARFGLSGHNGVDWGLPVKTPIVAVDAGEAIEVLDDPPGFGRYVKLKHTWGESLYAHLEQQLVRQGQTVGAGHLVGMSGNTGNSTGPHLHFGLRIAPYDRGDGWQGYADPHPYFYPPATGAIMGPHIIGSVGPHVALLRQWQPRLITVLDPNPDEMTALRAICPKAVIVGRVYRDDGEVKRRIGDGPEQAAAWAHAAILGRFAPEVDYWQLANEVLQDWGGLPLLARFEVERMRLAQERGYKCAILAFSVGNPDMPVDDRMALWRQVEPALVAADAGDHVVALHQYGKPNLWAPDPEWFIHRLEHQVLPRLGLKQLKFVVTEFGIDGLIWTQGGGPSGWSTFMNAEDYAGQLTKIGQYLERFSGQVLGYSIFTLGHNPPWQSYDIAGDVAGRLARYYEGLRTNGAPVETTPTPTTVVQETKEEGTVAGYQGNQATGFGAVVTPATVGAGEKWWRVVQVRHLPQEENGRRHHVYVDAVDEAGQRVQDARLRIAWDWEGRRQDEQAPPVPLDKPVGEAAGNVPIEKGQIIRVAITGDGLASDVVSGLHTNWPDEQPGNTVGHHSFHVIFQRAVAQATTPTQPTEPETPTMPPDNKDLSAQVAALQRQVAALECWQNTVTIWLKQLEGEL